MLPPLLLALSPTDFGVRTMLSPQPQARSAPQTKAVSRGTFSCSVASITDGDTLRCADGTRIRIAGIDAPEVGACATARQCVAGEGNASKRSLASLASGRTLIGRAVGTSYKCVVAFCSANGVDLSCAQVRARQAELRYSKKSRVCL
jgi:endonuclease YncB( thermonuclease family)